MKRVLLILFLVLSLLVSCSTTSQVKKPEPKAEEPKTEIAPPVNTEETVVNNEAEPVEESIPEEVFTEEDNPSDVSDDSEQIAAEPEINVDDTEEDTPSETPVENVETAESQDWSQVIGGDAPDVDTEEPEQIAEVAQAPVTEPAADPAQVPAKAEEPKSTGTAKKASFVDRITSFIKKTGKFISDEPLMSVGIFVCLFGLIYLIAALVISGRRDREKASSNSRKNPKYNDESDPFRPGSDDEPETDDDFLRRLLGDNYD